MSRRNGCSLAIGQAQPGKYTKYAAGNHIAGKAWSLTETG
jgi:hypothetical protein